jgi:hypothetical protein
LTPPTTLVTILVSIVKLSTLDFDRIAALGGNVVNGSGAI